MLSDILRKIASGDLEFSDKELKAALPYAHEILRQKPELLQALLPLVPEKQHVEALTIWFSDVLTADDGWQQALWIRQEVRRLSGEFADINEAALLEEGKYAAFYTAAEYGQTETLQHLMKWAEELGGKEAATNMLKSLGFRAFFLACEKGHIQTAAQIMDWVRSKKFGSDNLALEMLESHTFGAFCWAVGNGKSEVATQLMAWAKQLGNTTLMRKMFASQDYAAFMGACAKGHINTATQMLNWAKELGGDALAMEMFTNHQYEAFIWAARKGQKDIVRQLILWARELGGDALVLDMLQSDNCNALDWAVAYEHIEVAYEITDWAKELGGQEFARGLVDKVRKRIDKIDERELAGNEVWKKVYRQSAPHSSLWRKSPFKFSGKVYEAILPLVTSAYQMENARNPELGAYKLAVLFPNAQEAERYLDRYATEWNSLGNKRVMHDALLFKIPNNGVWNPNQWKDLVLKFGPAVSKYLGLAPKVETYIAEHALEFPKTPQELMEIVAQVHYGRAGEHPEFARVALQCGLSEETFNDGLRIIKKRSKASDLLPDIFIDGADIGHPTFYMEKLDANDPRGLVLGELTNCCQHLDDAGRPCAIHGFSSINGGFYVWKHKTKGKITPDDTIVAQSWAWRGKDNALVFDSFERLAPTYDKLVQPFMEQFAMDVRNYSFPDGKLREVHLGKGGGTPELPYMESRFGSEPIDYDNYRDSSRQYSVPARQHRKEQEVEPSFVAREIARPLPKQQGAVRG